MSGESVFLEREQVVVAVMLDTGSKEEDGDAEECAQGRSGAFFNVAEG